MFRKIGHIDFDVAPQTRRNPSISLISYCRVASNSILQQKSLTADFIGQERTTHHQGTSLA
jgi:hypothetical protein